jgi:hypothetical protein
MEGTMQIDTEILETILIHATSASRLAGRIADASDRAIVIDALTASIDEIVHELSDLLGNPHPIAAAVPRARSTFALDVTPDAVPECVVPDAPAASRTIAIAIGDGTRNVLVRLSDPDELGIALADDETTQPHIALSGGAR